jgi:hypothetical protein
MAISGDTPVPVPKPVQRESSREAVSDKEFFKPQLSDLPVVATTSELSKEKKAQIRDTVWLYQLIMRRTGG